MSIHYVLCKLVGVRVQWICIMRVNFFFKFKLIVILVLNKLLVWAYSVFIQLILVLSLSHHILSHTRRQILNLQKLFILLVSILLGSYRVDQIAFSSLRNFFLLHLTWLFIVSLQLWILLKHLVLFLLKYFFLLLNVLVFGIWAHFSKIYLSFLLLHLWRHLMLMLLLISNLYQNLWLWISSRRSLDFFNLVLPRNHLVLILLGDYLFLSMVLHVSLLFLRKTRIHWLLNLLLNFMRKLVLGLN